MNQRAAIDDQHAWITADEASQTLGVKHATLYAYVSRGLVRSQQARSGDRTRVYSKDDVDRLRARSAARAGHGPVAAGALRFGEPVLETAVGTIREDGPSYRGRSALELVRSGARFEEAAAILWEAPFERKGVQRQGGLGAPVAHLRAMLKQGADPFDAMLVTCAALAALEPRVEGSIESAKSRAPLLARRVIAAAGLVRGADAVTASLEADSAARALVVALGARATTSAIDALDEALVLLADHELNASTFAVRVAASTGASLAASVVAGLAAVSGPRHGAATARVEAFLEEVGKPERAAAAVGARLERGDAVPGFGHPLYPNGDPRGAQLLATALRIGGRSREVKTLTAIVSSMQLAAREKPTVDVGIVALSAALGLRKGAPLAIFAAGRVAGWIAHALEQRAASHLLRPRARYVGP